MRQIAQIARPAVRAGAANADGEKRAFRLAVRDPRWVPNPARPSRCRRVLLDRAPPAHADLREPLPGLSSRSGITGRRIRTLPSRRGASTAAESRLDHATDHEIARPAVRAGAANAGGEKRAFRLAVRDPRWVPNPARPSRCRRVLLDRVPPAHADLREPLPGLSSRPGITRRMMTRCPPAPCRCWAAAPVWSGPRAAESRFVTYHRSAPKQENQRGDSRGEFGLCDPRRSHATTGASVRLASVAHAKTSPAPVARTTRSGVSHASGAGRRGPASERVRGLGTKSPDQE